MAGGGATINLDLGGALEAMNALQGFTREFGVNQAKKNAIQTAIDFVVNCLETGVLPVSQTAKIAQVREKLMLAQADLAGLDNGVQEPLLMAEVHTLMAEILAYTQKVPAIDTNQTVFPADVLEGQNFSPFMVGTNLDRVTQLVINGTTRAITIQTPTTLGCGPIFKTAGSWPVLLYWDGMEPGDSPIAAGDYT